MDVGGVPMKNDIRGNVELIAMLIMLGLIVFYCILLVMLLL